MKLGLVGFPRVGKRTLLGALTGFTEDGKVTGAGTLALAKVRDARFEHLSRLYRPHRETPLQLEFAILPDMEKEAARNGSMFRSLEQVDVICLVVRAFEDDRVFHLHGTVDPARDLSLFHEELLLNDLLFVEKRTERIEKDRSPRQDARRAAMEMALLSRMQQHLESGLPLREFSLQEEERDLWRGFPLLSVKPLIVVLNVGEEGMGSPSSVERVVRGMEGHGARWIAVSAKVEREISMLLPEERPPFLEALGIDRPALDRFTVLCFDALGLICFFTVGSDEVRAWAVRRGATAPRAARAIHSDMERGFIRAEVMKFRELAAVGSEQKLKANGKVVQKGRDYVVQDGDIVSFLFNV
jgi:ribosome-binding ATPase